MKKWHAIVGVILVFLLGAVAGGLVTHTVGHKKMENGFRDEPKKMKEFIVGRLSRELHLDPEQREQLRSIVRETHIEIRNVRRQFRPQIEEVLARSQDRVRSILRPDQRERYEKIISEQKKRRLDRENSQ
ncbi:MAG TPA: periplasmic heavy metal sensor [Thermodesulfovibrionales bacterium]|nr:periplasmic heavy metal sensor [Thermodesulfovibrionales bacterium]